MYIELNPLKIKDQQLTPHIQDSTVVPMVSLLQRFHCTGQLAVVPMVPLLQRSHCTGQLAVVPMVDPYYRGFTVQDSLLWSQWCPYYRGFTVQDSLLWSQWCPYYRGFTVQDSLLWSQWCPYYRGFTVQDSLLWSQWCPYYTAEVSIYRTACCGPNGRSLLQRFHCTGQFAVVPVVSLLQRFHCTEQHCSPNGVLITEVSLCACMANYIKGYIYIRYIYIFTFKLHAHCAVNTRYIRIP